MPTVRNLLLPLLLALLAAACASQPRTPPSASHIQAPEATADPAGIPPLVPDLLPLPRPKPAPRAETYSVVVTNVRIQDLLFALARDARINLDIHPGLVGSVTLNAINQTLPQILTRLARQVDMRYEFDGPNLMVMPDSPFLRTYRIDYVNLSRSVSGTVSTNTQIATSGTGNLHAAGTGLPAGTPITGGNVSATRIENASRNQFWESVEKNIRDLLRETDKILPEGSSETVIENLFKINRDLRIRVKEVTLDMAGSMKLIAKKCFPNAVQVIDRFHVQKLATEALQDIRIRYRWEAIEQENILLADYKTPRSKVR